VPANAAMGGLNASANANASAIAMAVNHGAPATASATGWDCHVHVFDAAQPVQPGHYVPVHRPLEAIEQLAAQHGVGHLVLVQPSVYGSDNTVLLRALAAGQGRHRGVVVVEPGIDDAQLDAMHALGVRAVRFNLVSPAGYGRGADLAENEDGTGPLGAAAAVLRALAPRLRARGWFVQWYVGAAALPHLVSWQAETGLRFVLDHLAGLHAALPADDPSWHAVATLAQSGAWIKLSGWYRLGAAEPYSPLMPVLQRAAALFGAHTVWGSDWPHTSFAADQLPSYESTLQPLRAALGAQGLAAVMNEHAPALYA
jgi:predicted TIM-barrel fold metal-dependent hydrolase